jgi:CBS-domain-containing membrane protein
MNCAAIMSANPLTVLDEQSVAEAVTLLLDCGQTSLPVVDAHGCYVGMFGIDDLLGLLVPRVALAGDLTPNLRFIGDDPSDLHRRYREIANRRTGDVADRQAVALPSDAPQIEAIRLFCRYRAPIAVVARDTGKVEGIIAHTEAIGAMACVNGKSSA